MMILGAAASGDDYHFSNIMSKTFPASGSPVNYLVDDINDDGLDELIIAFPKSYYIYSFQMDSVIFRDTGMKVLGMSLADLDHDLIKDIVFAADSSGQRVYVQSGTFDGGRSLLCSPYTHYFYGTTGLNYAILVANADEDGDEDLILNTQVSCAVHWGPANDQAWKCTEILCLDMSTWQQLWGHYPYTNTIWANVPWSSSERTLCVDINGDDVVEILSFGYFYLYGEYGPGSEWVNQAYLLNSFTVNGTGRLISSSDRRIDIIGGDIDPSSTGNEIVLCEYGASVAGGGFLATDSCLLRRIEILDASVDTVWTVAGTPVTGDLNGRLFFFPSLAGTLCMPYGGNGFELLSGADGTRIGHVLGMDSSRTTVEGRFLATSQDAMTAIQLTGNRVDLFQVTEITDADDNTPPLAKTFELRQNAPNPFNPSTVIEYTVPHQTPVTMKIFNILGQKVRTLVSETKSAGSYRVEWNGTDDAGRPVAGGIYLYRLKADDYTKSKKMVLLK